MITLTRAQKDAIVIYGNIVCAAKAHERLSQQIADQVSVVCSVATLLVGYC